MKIFLINPDYGMTEGEIKERLTILSHHVSSDVELHMECLEKSRLFIDSELDIALAAPEIIEKALRAQKEGYDAVVLYCFSDPAIAALREVLSIPVVGAGQAACLMLPFIGREAALIILDAKRIAEKRRFIAASGLDPARITAVSAIDAGGLDPFKERAKTLDALTKAGEKLIEGNNAQVIILGCLSFLGLAEPLGERLGIPVIDPALAAVTMAEALVRQALTTSHKSYPVPPDRERSWSEGRI